MVGIPAGIANSAVRLKIWVITAGIKQYKSIIKTMRKEHDKNVLLGKPKLNIIKVLISKALINSLVSHDNFLSVNNV